MAKNLTVTNTGLYDSFPSIIIPSLIGISRDLNPNETVHATPSQASWIGINWKHFFFRSNYSNQLTNEFSKCCSKFCICGPPVCCRNWMVIERCDWKKKVINVGGYSTYYCLDYVGLCKLTHRNQYCVHVNGSRAWPEGSCIFNLYGWSNVSTIE